MLELCAHADIGDSLLQSWDGISASEALGKPKAGTKLVGEDCVCLFHADVAASFQDGQKMKNILEYPEMEEQVAHLLLAEGVSFPIRLASQMKMSIQNRGIPQNGVCRDVDVTFRATRQFLGNPWYDTIRYYYSMPDAEGVSNDYLAYGRCVCFLQDSQEQHFVILQCYNPYVAQVAGGGTAPSHHIADTMDRVTQLVPLHLAAVGKLYSYMLVPEEAIVNGGFILADPHVRNKHWVQQGHRESLIFQEFSTGVRSRRE